jgi:hypothetical protein
MGMKYIINEKMLKYDKQKLIKSISASYILIGVTFRVPGEFNLNYYT